MKRLGAIIAGGKASRFGGNKSTALLLGRPLIEHVALGLESQVDKIIICGAQWPGMDSVADRPRAHLGPLGGINAALYFAQQNGFDLVLTAGCDVLPVAQLPKDLPDGIAAYVTDHYVFGVWPASLWQTLDHHLAQQSDHSMRHWITTIGARAVPSVTPHYNLNTQEDLALHAARMRIAA